MAQEIRVPVSLEVVLSSINAVKAAIANLKPESKSWKALQDILHAMEREADKLLITMSKPFTSLTLFNAAEKSINKIDEALEKASLTISRLKFSDLKLDPSLLATFDNLKLQLVDILNEVKLFKVNAKAELLSGPVWDDIISIDPNAATRSFDELLKIVRKRNTELELEYNRAKLAADDFLKLDRAATFTEKAFNTKEGPLSKTVLLDKFDEFFKLRKGTTDVYDFKSGLKDLFYNWVKENFTLTDALLELIKGESANKIMQLFKGFKELALQLASAAHDTYNEKKEMADATGSKLVSATIAATAMGLLVDKLSVALASLGLRTDEVNNQLHLFEDAVTLSARSSNDFFSAETQLQRGLDQLRGSLNASNAEFLRMQRVLQSFNQMKMAVTNFLGFSLVLNLTKRAIREAINHIKELDSVMNKIAIVTDMTTGDLWNQVEAYSKMAQTYGTTILGAYEVSLIYYQLGLQTKDVLTLTNETLKLAKVSGLDYALTTDYMTTALRGFKMEMSEASTVVDVYSNLAAHTAVTLEELAVAMSKTASSLEGVGASFEESSAMISTMVAVTRESAVNIGSALKSIASRYGELKKDPLTLIDAEGDALDYNKVDTALKSVGITLKDSTGQFRNMTDVILELAEVWDLLESTQQRYIATLFAGNRQQSRFLALVSNKDLLKANLDYAENSEDVGTLLALKSLDSIESKLNLVKVAYLQFYTTIGIETAWKSMLDGATNVINTLNGLPKLFGKLPVAALGAISGVVVLLKDLGVKAITGFAQTFGQGLMSGLHTAEPLAKSGAERIFTSMMEAIKSKIGMAAQVGKETGETAVKGAILGAELAKTDTTLAKAGSAQMSPNQLTGINKHFYDRNIDAINAYKLGSSGFTVTDPSDLATAYSILGTQLHNTGKISETVWFDLLQLPENAKAILDLYFHSLETVNLKLLETGNTTLTVSGKISNFVNNHAKGISTFGQALNMAGMLINTTTTSGKALSGGLMSVGGAFNLAGIAVQAFNHKLNSIPWMAIISGIFAVVNGISQIIASTSDEAKLEELTKKAEELSNKAKLVRSDYKTLNNSVKKVDELAEKRYESAEAAEEYQDAVEDLTEKFPNLIAGFDASGNAILDVVEKEKVLAKARGDSAKATIEAAAGEKKRLLEELKLKKKLLKENTDFANASYNVAPPLAEDKTSFAYTTRFTSRLGRDDIKVDEEKHLWDRSDKLVDNAYWAMFTNTGLSDIFGSTDSTRMLSFLSHKYDFNGKSEEDAFYEYYRKAMSELIEHTVYDLKQGLITFYDENKGELSNLWLEDYRKKNPDSILLSSYTLDGIEISPTSDEIESSFPSYAVELLSVLAEHDKFGEYGELADALFYSASMNGYDYANFYTNHPEILDYLGLSVNEEKLEIEWEKIFENEWKAQDEEKYDQYSKVFSDYETYALENGIAYNKANALIYAMNKASESLTNGLFEEFDFYIQFYNDFIESAGLDDNKAEELKGMKETLIKKRQEIKDLEDRIATQDTTKISEAVNLIASEDTSGIYSFLENSSLLTALYYKQLGTISEVANAETADDVISVIKNNNLAQKLTTGFNDLVESLAFRYTETGESLLDIFNKMLENPQYYSDEDVVNFLLRYGIDTSKIDETVLELLRGRTDSISEYYEGLLNKLLSLQNLNFNNEENKNNLSQLSSFITNLIDNKELTKAETNYFLKGISYFTLLSSQGLSSAAGKYSESLLSVYIWISQLDSAVREILYKSIEENGIITREGINKIIDEAKVNNLDTTLLEGMRDNIVENLVLSIQTVLSNLADTWSDLTKTIKKLTSGLELSDVNAILNLAKTFSKIDSNYSLSLQDFITDGNKLILSTDDAMNYYNHYIESMSSLAHDMRISLNKAVSTLTNNKDFDSSKISNIDLSEYKLLEKDANIDALLLSLKNRNVLIELFRDDINQYIDIDKEDWVLKAGVDSEKFIEAINNSYVETAKALNDYDAMLVWATNSLTKELQWSLGDYSSLNSFYQFEDIKDKEGNVIKSVSELITERLLLILSGVEMTPDELKLPDMKNAAKLISSAYNTYISDLLSKNINTLYAEDYIQTGIGKEEIAQLMQDAQNKTAKEFAQWIAGLSETAGDALETLNDNFVKAWNKINASLTLDGIKNVQFLDENNFSASIEDLKTFANTYQLSINDMINNQIASYDEKTRLWIVKYSQLDKMGVDLSTISGFKEAVADSIDTFFDNLAKQIKNGINGSLSETEAKDLQLLAALLGITELLDFTKTSEGLKLSLKSAIELYNALKQVDGLKAKLVFDELNKSLKESNSHYKTIADILARIAQLEKIAPDARSKEYELELLLAKEIYKIRSITDEDDSFNFMSADIPGALKNPLNYWKNVSTMWNTIQDSITSTTDKGLMDAEDFYRIMTQFGSMAEASGVPIAVGAGKFVTNAEDAAKLIEEGYSALSVAADGTAKIDLSKAGIDFKASADDMGDGIDSGIKAIARSQIKMIDAAIAMLEAVEAMLSISDVDMTGDNKIDFGEIFDLDNGGAVRKEILEWLNLLTSSFNITVGDQSLADKLFSELSPDDLSTFFSDLYGIINNPEINPSDLPKEILELIKKFFPEETVEVGEGALLKLNINSETYKNGLYEKIRDAIKKGRTLGQAEKNGIITAIKLQNVALGTILENLLKKNSSLTLLDALEIAAIVTENGVITQGEDGKYNINYPGYEGENNFTTLDAALAALIGHLLNKLLIPNNSVKAKGSTITLRSGATINGIINTSTGTVTYTDGTLSFAVKEGEEGEKEAKDFFEAHAGQKVSTVKGTDSETTVESNAQVNLKLMYNSDTDTWYVGDQEVEDVHGAMTPVKEVLDAWRNLLPKNETGNTDESSDTPDRTETIDYNIKIDKEKYTITYNPTTKTWSMEGYGSVTGYDDPASAAKALLLKLSAKKYEERTPGQNNNKFDEITTLHYKIKIGDQVYEVTGNEKDGFTINDHTYPDAKTIEEALKSEFPADTIEAIDGGTVDYVITVNKKYKTVENELDKITSKYARKRQYNYGFGLDQKDGYEESVTYTKLLQTKVEDENLYLTTRERNNLIILKKEFEALKEKAEAENLYDGSSGKYALLISNIEQLLRTDDIRREDLTDATLLFSNISSENIIDLALALDSVKVNLQNLYEFPYEELAQRLSLITSLNSDAEDGLTIIVSYEADNTKAMDSAEETKEKIDAMRAAITITTSNNAESVVNSIKSALDNLVNGGPYIVTVKANVVSSNLGRAEGNVGSAKALGTLMGELGPELVVSNGRYFVVGQNGPEMVNLAKDAIVFNHLQTKSLLEKGMSSGRGQAVTNERNAVSYATGNVHGGPAMDIGSTIATLKQLRAQWESILNLSVKDLATKAGGGGGGGGSDTVRNSYIKEVERWYNLLQKIAQLEKEITYLEQERETIASRMNKRDGYQYFDSLKKSLDALTQEIAYYKELLRSQEEYFELRRLELNSSAFSSFYKFDKHGQLQYNDDNNAFAKLADLMSVDDKGMPKYSSKEQYDLILEYGRLYGVDFTEYMKYDSSGKEIAPSSAKGSKGTDEDTQFYTSSVQAFFDVIDSLKEEMQSLHDSIEEYAKKQLELEKKQNEILQAIEDNLIDVESKVMAALEDAAKREIDEMKNAKDALQESNEALIDGLTDQLNRERNMYQNSENETSLEAKRRQLAILQRSGGSASEISSLLAEIDSEAKDLYFDKLQELIDSIKEASDNLIEKLERQIELAEEALEYEKEHGLLWDRVYEIMTNLTPEEITDYITTNNSEFWSKSATDFGKENRDLLFKAEQWKGFQKQNVSIEEYAALIAESVANLAETEKLKTEELKALADDIVNTSQDTGGNTNNSNNKNKNNNEYKNYQYDETYHWKKKDKSDKEKHNYGGVLTNGSKCKVCGYQPSIYTPKSDAALKPTLVETAINAAKNITSSNVNAEVSPTIDLITQNTIALVKKKIGGKASGGYVKNPSVGFLAEEGEEAVLNAELTSILRNKILGSNRNSLMNLLLDFREAYSGLSDSVYGSVNNNDSSVVILHAEVNMHVDLLANGYDSSKAADDVMREMLNIARKTNAQNRIGR